MPRPEVTVFMAVHNGEKYIRQAIESVLQQTFKNFELLIIDDGSTDNSVSIITQYNDPRIRLLQNQKNLGLFLTRNRGVNEARGEYFATLDCDDVAVAERLDLQIDYFKKNPEAVICSGRIIYIDQHSKKIGKSAPISGDDDYIKSLLLFTNIFINSVTTTKTSVLKELLYKEGFEPAEDYELFERAAADYKIGIIHNVLGYYRVHSSNISSVKSHTRKIGEESIIRRQLKRYGFNYNNHELNTHLKFTAAEFESANPDDCIKWFNNLATQNDAKKVFNERSFKMALARQWLRLCIYRLKIKKDIKPFFKTGKIGYSYLWGALLRTI